MSSFETTLEPAVSRDQSRALFGQTMGLVAITTGFFAVGAYLGRDLSQGWGLVLFIASFGLLLGLNYAAQRSEQLAIAFLFGFGALVGLATAPTIAYYAETNPQSVWQAGGATALFIAGFGAAATRHGATSQASPALLLGAAGADRLRDRGDLREHPKQLPDLRDLGLVIFAGFTMYDFQRLRKTKDIRAAPLLAASIFLDVLNVFLLLLSLFNRR